MKNILNNYQTLNIIHSIIDELYEINNQKIESKEKHVHFTCQQKLNQIQIPINNILDTNKSSIIKYRPILSESTIVICCLKKYQSKIDSSVSTNDLPSQQSECATQTMDFTVFPKYNHSFISLLTTNNNLHQSKSNITLSTIWTSSNQRSTISSHSSLSLTTNQIPYSYENNTIIPSLNTAQQLITPSPVKCYDICHEQILENSNTNKNFNDHENLNIKFCTCSKRKLTENYFSIIKFVFFNQNKLLEELNLSKRSLQLMHNDDLFYIYDLILVFLRNTSQFYNILLKNYYLSKKQANLFVKIMNKWWKKYQRKFIDINQNLSG